MNRGRDSRLARVLHKAVSRERSKLMDFRATQAYVFLLAVFVSTAAYGSRTGVAEFDFGPIVSRHVDVNGDTRLRALGPLFEKASSEDGKSFAAVRPLFSNTKDPVMERETTEVLWPLASVRDFRDETYWRVLTAIYQDWDVNNPYSRYRFWILPLYFQGRDVRMRNYVALFPLGGRINEFLGRDEISFWLFPLTAYSSINNVKTRDVLWPFISRTKGKGIYRFRVAPFYGQSKHRDKFKKRFIAWPFWTSAEYYYKGSSGKGYIAFPLWGHIKLEDQESWLVLPPLFRFNKGQRLNYGYAPWPFFSYSSGEVEKFSLWPIYGRKATHGVESQYFLWPIFWKEEMDRGDSVGHRFAALPFWQSESRVERGYQAGSTHKKVYVYRKLWPLASYIRDGAARRFRMLSLWPLKDTPQIERNWAPLWTLYQNTSIENVSEQELLWGLFRRQREGDEYAWTSIFPLFEWSADRRDKEERSWSILKGLIGYERLNDNKSLRLLYFIRFGGRGTEP
ncbi:MAG: hypothetical protein KJ626_06270 [Verrucomicrobia bacterium]|nr:hypothetical protein [Verrucomicrobiota bacterium]